MSIRIPDTVHGEIEIADRYREVLESPVLARLRNVRQLGFTLASYPGAVHTRFEHTLGTCTVLMRLLDLFAVRDEGIRHTLLLHSLTSEIGITPFSYSARAVFLPFGIEKAAMAEELRATYLATVPRRTDTANWPEEAKGTWNRVIDVAPEFTYLDPIKLASTIDYVLRDSHYTGRGLGAFDFRYLMSCDPRHDYGGIIDSLHALHRAVDLLNATYGDFRRRALTVALKRLCQLLVQEGTLDLSEYKLARNYVALDDDRFLEVLSSSIDACEEPAQSHARVFFEVATQRIALTVFQMPIGGVADVMDDEGAIRNRFAGQCNCLPAQLVLVGHPFDEEIGFRMFGVDYSSYGEACRSERYRRLTQLASGLEELKMAQECVYAMFVL